MVEGCGPRCGLRGGPAWRGGRTGGGSGGRSRPGDRARTRPGTAVYPRRWFREAGGMPPSHLTPSAPLPSGGHLSFVEREEIALLRAQDHGVREIARRVGRALSTISRELRRNAATRSGRLEYWASTAQWYAERAARRPKAAKLATNDALRRYVEDRLSGRIVHPDGTLLDGPRTVWRKRRHGPRQPRRWAQAWSDLRRSRPGSGSTSPRTSRCASATRRSIAPSTFRAAARCGAS